jgi:hypothetical protein
VETEYQTFLEVPNLPGTAYKPQWNEKEDDMIPERRTMRRTAMAA